MSNDSNILCITPSGSPSASGIVSLSRGAASACSEPRAEFSGTLHIQATVRSTSCSCNRLWSSGSEFPLHVSLNIEVMGFLGADRWSLVGLNFPGPALGDDRYCEVCSRTTPRIFQWRVVPSEFRLECLCGFEAPAPAQFWSELGLELPTHALTLESSREAFRLFGRERGRVLRDRWMAPHRPFSLLSQGNGVDA